MGKLTDLYCQTWWTFWHPIWESRRHRSRVTSANYAFLLSPTWGVERQLAGGKSTSWQNHQQWFSHPLFLIFSLFAIWNWDFLFRKYLWYFLGMYLFLKGKSPEDWCQWPRWSQIDSPAFVLQQKPEKTNDVAHKGSSSFDWDSVLEKERAQHEIGKYSNRINKILSIRWK